MFKELEATIHDLQLNLLLVKNKSIKLPFTLTKNKNLLTYHLPLKQEIWLAVYSTFNRLVWHTYISHLLTLSLTHLPVHNIPNVPTKRYFFYKKITQKLQIRWIGSLFCFSSLSKLGQDMKQALLQNPPLMHC